ncbi:protein RRP5 homolog isoform X1 [Siniperca chuatsi]|uniref:protein RRP5 homolog isoform X1 n=1 Tax=Siniperca chuatsi TaxID=119488 RepID=UPI001CE1CD88|nr:protein RRP5 homolog isoform X1 [Siniperca chuatsi]XP_044047426.1 protein RRP5 homolog isoform X1 [Siniperca chuatsi]XP_044047427.1 protein RRP5 homolog isoform X1 [Siniperca chuatsi]
MASVEEDFPRGGTAKKPTESKIVVQRTEVDNLFQSNEQAETKKRKGAVKEDGKKLKKQKTGKEKEDGLTLNAAAKCVEILHIKNVKEGMLMLGCVKEVTDFEVTVSLPCGLQGFLSIKNICDSYTKLLSEQLDSADTEEICSLPHLFHSGMVFRCVVAKLDVAKGGSLSIQLSIDPKLVNKALTSSSVKAGMVLSGCVESVEDHGYIVDIGINGTKAFLPKKVANDKHNNPEELKVGQYVTSQVEEVKNNGRMVRLSVSPPAVSQACAETEQGWNLTNLLPGLLVKATIKKVTKHGLILDFLSSFSGQVDFLHMEPEQASSYTEGTKVRACVLYVEPSTRLVALSLRSYLVQPGTRVDPSPAGGDRIGEVVKDCKITTMHHMSGAMLELPDKTLAFVHRNHLKESNEPANENRVLAMSEHTCRILDFSLMDQIHFVSLRKSVIERLFYRYHDLQAGQVVEGRVSVLLNHGMIVHLSDHIKGLVPRTHLSDIILKNPEKKYMEGMKVKCRVLSVDAENKKLYLTRKKAMIESSLPLFLSYSDARPGRVSHGYIVCIKEFGCIVRFYNSIKGLVPLNELSSEPIISPEDLFYVGQVLKAKVLQCDPDKAKMVLSFKAAVEGDTEEAAKPQFDCEVGKRLEAKVLKKSVNGLEVAILPDEIRAVLPTMHLSDHISNCPLLWENLQEGDNVSNLICFNKNKQNITLTKKPTVRWSLEEGVVAKDFSEITVGMQLIGWIKNIMSYGVFVEFPYGLVGLAPKSAMTDKFISDATTAFQLGQTVFAKVTNLDEEKRRFLVTLKISEVISPEGDAQTRLINGLQERRAVTEMLAMRDDSDLRQQLAALSVGQKLKLTVDTAKDSGATFKSDDLGSATILATKYHVMGVNLTPGQKVTAVILHVDILSACVHVSILSKLVGKKKSLTEGSKYTAMVQHIDKDFAIISLDDTAQLTVIQTSNHLNEMFLSESEKLKAGMSLTVEVIEPSCQELQGLPLVSWVRSAPKRQRTTSENQTGSKGHRYGEIVQAKVRTVKPTSIQVTLEDGSTGSVHVSEVVEVSEVCRGSFPTSSIKVGSVVTARVIGGREASSHRFLPFSHPKFTYTIPELTLIPSKLDESADFKPVTAKEKLNSYKLGEEITCFVSKFNPERKSLEVTTDPCVTGTVELLAMITDPKDASHPEKLYKLGQAVHAKVVEVNSKPQRFVLSLTGVHKLEKGSVTLGMVTNIQPQVGLLVKLPFGGMGTVAVTELADAYRPNPLDGYSKDQLLRCFLLGNENGKWQLSLRPTRLNPQQAKPVKDPEVLSVDKLKAGQIIRGYVKSVGEQGVFIRLSKSITGRAELQQSTKYFVNNHKVLSEHLPVNTLLTTKILSIDKEQVLVNLSLLPLDTGKPDILPESLGLPLRLIGEEKKKHDTEKKKRTLSESKEKQAESQVPKKKSKKAKTDDNDSGVEVYFREEEDKEDEEPKCDSIKQVPHSSVGPPRLQVAAGFSWDVGLSSLKPASAAPEGDFSDGEDQDGSSKPQKKSRHELEQEKKAAEKALVQREAELMDPSLRPQDAAAFERLLLASPNSSLLWLQYMAHHLQATQIEQARAVAERALKTISFREEQEKLNVWVALLNLENMYGTADSLKKVFERALQFCEPMPVYQQLADIYAKSDKTKEAEGLYKTMVKRFRQNKAVWLSYGTFLLQQGQSDAASALLQRALKSLPSKESVDVIGKFAQLEFRYGDAEKGRTMFDKVLTSYPKRTDLWSVFIDLMVKHGSQKEVRALFDRVIHLSVSVKKIKFFFKRYLEYEKKHGTPQSIQSVKEKAMEFVEAKGTEAAN